MMILSNHCKCEFCGKIVNEGTKFVLQQEYLPKLSINLCEEHLNIIRDDIIKKLLNRKILIIDVEVKNEKR